MHMTVAIQVRRTDADGQNLLDLTPELFLDQSHAGGCCQGDRRKCPRHALRCESAEEGVLSERRILD